MLLERCQILVFLSLALFSGTRCGTKVSNKCLACICHAMTKCNFNRGCTTSPIGTKICGVFFMTKPYWTESGQNTIEGDNIDSEQAFENCANDARCARQTLRGYMNRYKRDCNGDGKINCEDYARIHAFGPTGCRDSSRLTHKVYKEFIACREDLSLTDDD